MPDKQKIVKAREAVDAYRLAHTQLYSGGWYKGIPEAHTPLLNTMLSDLKKQDFNSLDEFFTASEELNMQELGFKDKADFDSKATDADRKALEGKWR
jgi:NADH:ubiquinone oxidoreductase subunit D